MLGNKLPDIPTYVNKTVHALIEAIPNIHTKGAVKKDVGFFGKLVAFNWFKSVFVYVAIQQNIDAYQKEVRDHTRR